MYAKKMYTIILCLALSFQLFAQTKEAKIKEIKQIVQSISKTKNLQKSLLRGDEFVKDASPDGGAELTGYFKKGELVKIIESIGLSYGMNDVEYCFKNEKLIFVYETERYYPFNKKTSSFDHTELNVPAFQGRYYFDNDKLIKTSIKGNKRFKEDEKYDVVQLLKQVNQYKTLLKAKTR